MRARGEVLDARARLQPLARGPCAIPIDGDVAGDAGNLNAGQIQVGAAKCHERAKGLRGHRVLAASCALVPCNPIYTRAESQHRLAGAPTWKSSISACQPAAAAAQTPVAAQAVEEKRMLEGRRDRELTPPAPRPSLAPAGQIPRRIRA